MALLEVENLGVIYRRRGHAVVALDRVSLNLQAGERLAVLGESGSGKSTLGLALGGLLPAATDVSGAIRWPGFGDRQPRLGKDIGFVFQNPAGSLDPLMRVGDQVAEVLRAHASIGAADAAVRATALLDQVSLTTGVATAWPHQLSGGQKQRVALACAIVAGPALLVADEATSALDTIVQASILALLRRLVELGNMALLLITHDIAVAASNADRIAVLQHGGLVEIGSATQIVHAPREPYTRRLVAAHIALDAPPRLAGTRP